MRIRHVEIQNFRKLKCCRIDFGSTETVFVGANNSGKTSAIHSLILFLKKERRKEISVTDFTLSNWNELNKIGESWLTISEEQQLNLEVAQWRPNLPSLDVWIDVKDSELHLVNQLFPSLSWKGGLLGVRLILEPKTNQERNTEKFYKEFLQAKKEIQKLSDGESTLPQNLWPKNLKDFLKRKNNLNKYFEVNSYILNPNHLEKPSNGEAQPQELPPNSPPLESEPFSHLFKIDVINAQRGFSDPSSNVSDSNTSSLSVQLRNYYDKHLDPEELPGKEDLDVLLAMDQARKEFDVKLTQKFSTAIQELETLGYPGLSDPTISLSSKVNPIDGLSHDSAVQFNVLDGTGSMEGLTLPEKYNGLGYQNLISMVFKLIQFRDEWMRKGNIEKQMENEDDIIEPLHLVLIEEPEAHLHAQVQQVFIDKAYDVLRNHEKLKSSSETYYTQLIASTHSNHVAHEVNFSCLRYFKKILGNTDTVPCALVVNLTETFGKKTETARFSTRYLKATHSNLFFADAVILVEGAAERLLVPHFIKKHYPVLDSLYITVLEIGGSHAHKLRPLIEELEIITLVITDLDSANQKGTKEYPKKGTNQKTKNHTLKEWLPQLENIDDLIVSSDLSSNNNLVRIAYQQSINLVDKDSNDIELIPYTFEDALVLSNIEVFKGITATKGLLKKMHLASNKGLPDAGESLYEALKNSNKAEMALDLLFLEDPDPAELNPPDYIKSGLDWLEKKLKGKNDLTITALSTGDEENE